MNPVQNINDWRIDRPSHASPTMLHYPGASLEHGSYASSMPAAPHAAPLHPPMHPSSHFMSPARSDADPRLPGVSFSQPSTSRPAPLSHATPGKPVYGLPAAYSGSVDLASSVMRKRSRSDAHYSPDANLFFLGTESCDNLYALDRTTLLTARIQAKFDRGFFLADNEWTCYRRNYFQVSAAFTVPGMPHYFQEHGLPCLVSDGGQLHPVHGFRLGLSAHVVNNDKEIQLIQHTPKRDKGPQSVPQPRPVAPGGNLSMSGISNSPGVVSFERIQFKSATANNGKRRAAQQYFVCVVTLYAEMDGGHLIKVGSCASAPLVVRGRSPGHYSDNQSAGVYDGARGNTVPGNTPSHAGQHDDRFATAHPPFSRGALDSPGMLAQDYPQYPFYSSFGYQQTPPLATPPALPLSQPQSQSQSQHPEPSTPTQQQPNHGYMVSNMSSSSESSSPDMYTADVGNSLLHQNPVTGDELKSIQLDHSNNSWLRPRFHSISSQDAAFYPTSTAVSGPTSAYDPRKYSSVPNLMNQ